MTSIEELRDSIETLVFKYNIKKEYFTVLLPVLIGLTIVLGAYMSGHTLGSQTPQVNSQADAKKQALEAFIQSQGGEVDDNATKPQTSTQQQPKTTPDLDHYIIYGTIIACIPYSIDRYLEKRRFQHYEDDFTQFLFKLSEMMRAGMDPIKSVIELSKTDLGSLSPHVKTAASLMLLGRSFEEGMKNMASALHSEMISKYVDLVIQASYMGGSVHDLILKASEDMRTMLVIESEMLGNLKQYTVIFYLAQAIIIFIAYILSAQLIPFIQGPGATMLFGNGDLQKIDFTHSFFHLIMINAAIGGIIIGKISEGSMKDGFKHTVILMSISYLVCVTAILPLSSPNDNYIITPVSGTDQTAMPGMKLHDPIAFNVTDKSGKPVPGVDVQFSISPSGSVNPVYAKTDNNSRVEVKITLGKDIADYIVTAKVEGSTGNTTITATSGGGG